MKQYILNPSEYTVATEAWRQHPFYKSATVLGLDIGLKGIGVCVRKGGEVLYAKTWIYDVPESKRLEPRRQKRAWRHCRSNRKTRLRRLRDLMAKHGLPWVAEGSPASLASDPFILRHRAVTKVLASKQALSLAIRHCVAHRGYDYEYFNEEGAYPWGDSTEFKPVMNALEGLWLTHTDAERARSEASAFEHWSDDQKQSFDLAVSGRTSGPEIIEARLALHARGSRKHLKARAKGEAFPRKFVWEHLEKIVRRHAHLIDDAEGFLAALAGKPDCPESRAKAIFFYHRKTPTEMREHFDGKRKRCRTALWLGLGDQPVASGADIDVRAFRVLEFLAGRRLQLIVGKTRQNPGTLTFAKVSAARCQAVLAWLRANPKARLEREVKPVMDEIVEEAETASDGEVAPLRGKHKSEHNVAFFKQLRDLLAPGVAARGGTTSLSTAAALKLMDLATQNGFDPDSVTVALGDYYKFRRQPEIDLDGVYPQIEFLLGQRVRKGRTRNGKTRGALAHPGKLQLLWSALGDALGGVSSPDYCVVEMARDIPRDVLQRAEIEKKIAENEDRRRKLYELHHLPADAKGSTRRRVELYDQQMGVCPFTGDPLGSPLADNLEVEHLFPQESGGLSMDENLVLTFRTVNAEKGRRTPRQYATAKGIPFETMLARTASMRWGRRKRELFAWEDADEIPDLGNTTRVAQLARQLWGELAEWMGIHQIDDPTERENERARRIGTPTGFMTSACRKAWGLPQKDRADLTHHLVDAAILAFIPPQKGQNMIYAGGIFHPKADAQGRRNVLGVLPLGPSSATIARLAAHDATECPILRHRSTSRHRRIHDTTMWRVLPDGALAQRTGINKESALADELLADLRASGIPDSRTQKDGTQVKLVPTRGALEKWLTQDGDKPLRLLDGTPVRSIWKRSKKGDLAEDPLGFVAVKSANGHLREVKAILENWDRIEIWRGWDSKKKKWSFFKQIVPTRAVLDALRKIGIRWDQRPKKPWRVGAPELPASLKELIAGKLPPFARPAIHPVTGKSLVVRKGDLFRIGFTVGGKLAKRGEPVARHAWVSVASVGKTGRGRIEVKDVFSGAKLKEAPMSVDDIAFLAGLPSADDSSSYPSQRKP